MYAQYHYETSPFETEKSLLRQAELRFKKMLETAPWPTGIGRWQWDWRTFSPWKIPTPWAVVQEVEDQDG